MATQRGKLVTAFVQMVATNRLTLFGANLATVSALAIIATLALLLAGTVHHGYVGLLLFLVLPVLFIAGLLLIPAGLVWERRKPAEERAAPSEHPYPVFDFNSPRTRAVFKSVAILTVVNVLLLSIVSYQGVVYSESNQFCGMACHTPMEPQYTAFLDSPHQGVGCVDCHIGEGVSGFVSAKMAGVRQMVEVAADSYPRPIPTVRDPHFPARETCLHCHTPADGREQIFKVSSKFLEDEANTEVHTAMLLPLGDTDDDSGIHGWHNQDDREITFLPADKHLETILAVRVEEPDGTVREYRTPEADETETSEPWRAMTCVDCHNRVGHKFHTPVPALDSAMAEGEIPPDVPNIKSVGLQAFTAALEGNVSADGVADHVVGIYEDSYAAVLSEQREAVEAAAESVETVYQRNAFPSMNVDGSTYADFSGHTEFSGCFRCHDDNHTTEDGRAIRQDCTVCHNVLAWDEEEPDILKQLNLLEP